MLASPARCRYCTIVALRGHQLLRLLYILALVLCRFVQHLIASVTSKGGVLILETMKMFHCLVCTLQPVLRALYWGLGVPVILLLLVFPPTTFLSPSGHHNGGAVLADLHHTHPPPNTLNTSLREHDVHAKLPWYAPAPLFIAAAITRNETRDCNTYTRTCSFLPVVPRKDWPWYVSLAWRAAFVRKSGVCFHSCAAVLFSFPLPFSVTAGCVIPTPRKQL